MNDKEKLQYLYEKEKAKEKKQEKKQGQVLFAGRMVGYLIIAAFKIVVMSFFPLLFFYFILGIGGTLLIILSLIAGAFFFYIREGKDIKEEIGNRTMVENCKSDYPEFVKIEEYLKLNKEERSCILQRAGMNGMNQKIYYIQHEMEIATDDLVKNFNQYPSEVCEVLFEIENTKAEPVRELLENCVNEAIKVNGITGPGLELSTVNYATLVRNSALLLKTRLKHLSPHVRKDLTQEQLDKLNEMISEEIKEKSEKAILSK
ncbi:MAG: hypothetical protein KAQ64_05235 [Candidatus Pacebacteria bacterium]|nr:hypothetical protein [Candidatus Paceibacterota bacterium]